MRLSPLRAAALTLLPASGLLGVGCASSGGANTVVARDVLEIKHMIEDQKRNDESQQRQLEYRLKNVETTGDTQTNLLKSSLAEMEESLRRQQQSIDAMQRDIKSLSAQIGSKPSESSVATASPVPAAVPTPSTATEPTPAATAASAEELIEQGLQNYNSGNYGGAKESFEKAIAANPPSKDSVIKARYWLSQSAMQLNDLPAAQESYFKVIEIDNTHPLAWQSLEGLAQVYQRQGKGDTALKYYNVILKDNPAYPHIDRVKEQVKALGASKP